MKVPAFKKIVIIGLGLMGGSLAADIRKKFPGAKVAGIARRKKTIQFARRKKWIHFGSSDLKTNLRGADLVIICLPVDLIAKTLLQIEKQAEDSLLVTDVGSVKNPLCQFYKKKKWKRVRFVGAHPMVGSHEKGIQAAKAGLYRGGLTVLTPSRDLEAQKAVQAFWEKISRRVVALPPQEHDRRVALISHLPHLASVCLAGTADKQALQIASTGFRDMTRLAKGDKTIWEPIFSENRREVIQAIRSFKFKLDQFIACLIKEDKVHLRKLLEEGTRSSFR